MREETEHILNAIINAIVSEGAKILNAFAPQGNLFLIFTLKDLLSVLKPRLIKIKDVQSRNKVYSPKQIFLFSRDVKISPDVLIE